MKLETGHLAVRVLKEGANAQEFKFGNKTKVAGIGYVESAGTFEIRGQEENKLAVFDSSGNLNIKGVLIQNTSLEADEDDFIVKNATNGLNLVVKNPEGNIMIKGFLKENEGSLKPTPNSLVIQNKKGEAVAYVNSTGSLFLTGTMTESASFE